MNLEKHIDHLVSDFLDGHLTTLEKNYFTAHVEECPRCLSTVASHQELMEQTKELPSTVDVPEIVWQNIESAITNLEGSTTRASDSAPTRRRIPRIGLTFLAAAATLIVGALLILLTNSNRHLEGANDAWNISMVEGSVLLDSDTLQAGRSIVQGQILKTSSSSQASIEVGEIGTVDVFPESTIELLSTSDNDHRFDLSRGGIHAVINAPPRLFFVETPSATAIDLGCEYTLEVDSAGVSSLHVQFGYVELSHPLTSSTIPEGYRAISTPESGPTVAIDEDASEDFVSHVVRYSLQNDREALPDLISAATAMDAITLWLLLQSSRETSDEDKRAIYSRLVTLVGEPADVSMQGALVENNQAMIGAWQLFLGMDLALMTFDSKSSKKKKRRQK